MGEGKKRILVAEGDAAARVLLRRRLEAEGFDVTVVEDGEAALLAIRQELPDLLVVDVSLPKVDGIQVIRQTRTVGSGGNLPIVALSAHGRELVERGLEGVRGPDALFAKPIDYRALQAKLASLLAPPPAVAAGNGHLAEAGGRLVAFVGAKGGVGTTTIALNVAVTLARLGHRTVLHDTARFHGTTGSLWGIVGGGTIDQLSLDEAVPTSTDHLDGALRTHHSGLRVLLSHGVGRPDPSAAWVMALANGLRSLAGHVVVDLDSAVDVVGQVVLRIADRIWVVTEPEPAAIERAAALIALLAGWGVDPRSIGLLVNQTSPEVRMEPAAIGQRVGRPVGCWTPSATEAAFEANRRRLPLVETARDHPAAVTLAAMAASLAARPMAVAR